MAHFIITTPAAQDLEGIADYIAKDNPEAAVKTVDAMINKFGLLAERPLMHASQPKYKNLRKAKVSNYLIFYRPITGGVEILRVIHAGRDIEAVLESAHRGGTCQH